MAVMFEPPWVIGYESVRSGPRARAPVCDGQRLPVAWGPTPRRLGRAGDPRDDPRGLLQADLQPALRQPLVAAGGRVGRVDVGVYVRVAGGPCVFRGAGSDARPGRTRQ